MTVLTETASEEIPVGRRTGPGYWLICAVAAAVVAVLHYLCNRSFTGWMTDMQVYTEASRLSGEALYTQPVGPFDLLFQYPPFIADIFRGVAGINVSVLGVVCNTGSLLALTAVLLACLRRQGISERAAMTWAPVIMVFSPLLEPIDNCLAMGQVDIFLMALVVLDLVVLRGSRWQGVGIGIATGIKLVPIAFVAYLVLTRRFRAAATALGTFVVIVIAGFITRPVESRYFWTHVGLGPKGEEPALLFSRSTWSILVRATHDAASLSFVRIAGEVIMVLLVVVALGTIIRVRNSHWGAGIESYSEPARQAIDVIAMLCVALAVPLLLRISWVQYWVWIAPALAVLARWAWLRRSTPGFIGTALLLLVFTLRPHSWGIMPSQDGLSLTWLENVQTGLFPVATIVLLLCVAWRLRSRGSDTPALLAGELSRTSAAVPLPPHLPRPVR